MRLMRFMLLTLFLCHPLDGWADTVVASYRADFSADAPLSEGWEYLWNAPSGWVANASSGDLRSGFIGVPGEYVSE